MTLDFITNSYDSHRNGYSNSLNVDKLNSWKRKTTVDYWRHERMYSSLKPIILAYPKSTWLTVGDGRYGTDANYLISNGVENVIASDISDTLLKIALNDKFITQYKIENAENLSFENNSIDFVLCKESYHHFPRPSLALYEMLRIAKNAVILIEPQDSNILIPARFGLRTLLNWTKQVIKNRIKKQIGKEPYYCYGNYEEVGNYVYSISEREIEKVALGLNYDMVSFKGINDSYADGVEFEEADENSELFKKIKKNIKSSDLRTQKGLQSAGLLTAIIFKKMPNKECILELETRGFINRLLPKNPYV